jgi:hypothetical protein
VAPFKSVANYLSSHELGTSFDLIKLKGARLRKSGHLPVSKHGFGAIGLDTPHAVNLAAAALLALTNTDAVATVDALRSCTITGANYRVPGGVASMRPATEAFGAVSELGISLGTDHTAASMLDIVVNAMRSGAFDHWAGQDGFVCADFEDAGKRVVIYFDRPSRDEGAFFTFGERTAKAAPVEKWTRVNDSVLRGLAKVLGPLQSPPPPY